MDANVGRPVSAARDIATFERREETMASIGCHGKKDDQSTRGSSRQKIFGNLQHKHVLLLHSGI